MRRLAAGNAIVVDDPFAQASQVQKPTEKISITIGTLSGLVMMFLKLSFVIARPPNASVSIKTAQANTGCVTVRRKISARVNSVAAIMKYVTGPMTQSIRSRSHGKIAGP